jgi:hypothetical protein
MTSSLAMAAPGSSIVWRTERAGEVNVAAGLRWPQAPPRVFTGARRPINLDVDLAAEIAQRRFGEA